MGDVGLDKWWWIMERHKKNGDHIITDITPLSMIDPLKKMKRFDY